MLALAAGLAASAAPIARILDTEQGRVVTFEISGRSGWPITVEGSFPYSRHEWLVYLGHPDERVDVGGKQWSVYRSDSGLVLPHGEGTGDLRIAEGSWELETRVRFTDRYRGLEPINALLQAKHVGRALPLIVTGRYRTMLDRPVMDLLREAEQSQERIPAGERGIPVRDLVLSVMVNDTANGFLWGRGAFRDRYRWPEMDTWGYVFLPGNQPPRGLVRPVYTFTDREAQSYLRWCMRHVKQACPNRPGRWVPPPE